MSFLAWRRAAALFCVFIPVEGGLSTEDVCVIPAKGDFGVVRPAEAGGDGVPAEGAIVVICMAEEGCARHLPSSWLA